MTTFATAVRTWGSHPNLFVYSPRPLWRALGRGDWDVLDIHEEPCSIAAGRDASARARCVGCACPFVLYSAQNIDKRYPVPFRWIEKLGAASRSGRIGLQQRGRSDSAAQRTARRRAVEIPLGVDLDVFACRTRGRRQLHRAPRVGYVGRLVDHKGVDVLIDAMAELPASARWSLVGSGPAEADLRARSRAGTR